MPAALTCGIVRDDPHSVYLRVKERIVAIFEANRVAIGPYHEERGAPRKEQRVRSTPREMPWRLV